MPSRLDSLRFRNLILQKPFEWLQFLKIEKNFANCTIPVARKPNLLVELPNDLRGEWNEFIDLKQHVLELGKLTYRSSLTRIPPNELVDWRVNDFENYEVRALTEIVFQLHVNKPFSSRINLTEGEMSEISSILSQLMESERMDRPAIEKRQEMANLMSSGRTLEANKASLEYEIEVARYQSPTVTRILDEVLAQEQAMTIRSLAKSERCYLETGYGDVFGLFSEFATSRSIGSDLRNRFESKLNEVRKEYYELVNKKREEIEIEVKELLGADKWGVFVERFGEFYNLEAERVLAWDKSRK